MRQHPRIRKTIKWGGLALAVVLVGAWVVTIWKEATYYSGDGHFLSLRGGGVQFFVNRGEYLHRPRRSLLTGPSDGSMSWWPRSIFGSAYIYVEMPLWVPLVPVSAATAAAWRLDTLARRRVKMHVCKSCGYDLAGLGSAAACPECGKAV